MKVCALLHDENLLKSVPKLYAVIVKRGRNFFHFLFIDGISSVLDSGIKGGNFKPKTFQKIKS